MMPAKSTSDQRTYSSMMKGPGVMPGEGRMLPSSAEAVQAVGLEPAPQRRAADAEPARRLRELAACVLQRLDDRLPLAVGQRLRPGGEDRRLADRLRAALQGGEPGTKGLQPVADIPVLAIDDAARRGVGEEHSTLRVEHHDAFADRIDHGPSEGEKAGGAAAATGLSIICELHLSTNPRVTRFQAEPRGRVRLVSG